MTTSPDAVKFWLMLGGSGNPWGPQVRIVPSIEPPELAAGETFPVGAHYKLTREEAGAYAATLLPVVEG